jgi:phosphate transport system substrate-binding protein
MKMKANCTLCAALAVIVLAGCQERHQTTTKGSIQVLVGESVFPLVQKEVAEFTRLYEQASIEITPTTSREAIIQLLTGKVATIIVSRELNEEEKRVVEAYKLPVRSWRYAMDAVLIIVNPKNEVSRITFADARKVFSGETRNWKSLGGASQDIELFVLSRNSGTSEFFLNSVVHDTLFGTSARRCSTSAQLVELVATRPNAIGVVGMAWKGEKVKVLDVAVSDTSAFAAPYQASIYQGEYSLRRTIQIMSTDTGYAGLATGFVTFLASAQGQKVVRDFGLVPVTMPVKIVRFQ